MSETISPVPACASSQEPSVLEEENQRLRQENERLVRELEEHRRREQTLWESEQRLHAVLDNMLTGLLIVDRQTHQITEVNPHAAEIIGLPREQIVGRICHQFVCPAEKGSCPISDLGQTVDRSERWLLKADGTRVPILKTVVSSAWQGHEYLIESFIDISRLQRAQTQAQESLSLLEATLDATPDGILAVDLAGKIKSFNRQLKRLWNIPDALLRSGNDKEPLAYALNQLQNPDRILARLEELHRQPEAETFDLLELKDGRVMESHSKPQVLGEQVVGRVWDFRDVTERHRAEQQQAALLRRVADINEELSHFAYVVSHDLKAPLRGITLLAEWLCEDYGEKLGPEAKEQIALLQSRVNRMHSLIDGVLQYSRVGRIKEDMVAVNLNELMPALLDTLAPPAHIRITVDPNLPTVTCERTRIIQVFQNLLSNAVKFMDKPQGEIHVGCTEETGHWRFCVADNGPGIEAKHFERIFRIFQTLAPRDEHESTGIGLALVKRIVELYGGRVWVESEVGKGTTFFFTLPQAPPAEMAAMPSGD